MIVPRVRVNGEQAGLVQSYCSEQAYGTQGSPFLLRSSECMCVSDWFKEVEAGKQVYLNSGLYNKVSGWVGLEIVKSPFAKNHCSRKKNQQSKHLS